jgi:hypothetical protein
MDNYSNIYRSGTTAVFLVSLNGYALIALSIVVWMNKGFWNAAVIFFVPRLAQYVLNFIVSAIFVNLKKNFLDNPVQSTVQISWLRVASDTLILAIAVYAAKFWL